MEIGIAIIATLISFLALGLSVYQIYLSNKQQLFDRRLKVFLDLKEILISCENYCKNPKIFGEELVIQNIAWDYGILTDNELLDNISGLLDKFYKSEGKNIYVKYMSNVNKLSYEAKLVLPKKVSIRIFDLITSYIESINACAAYYEIVYRMQNGLYETSPFKLDKENEELYQKMALNCLSGLKNIYTEFVKDKIEQEIEKKIKL